jgi:uncharacterized protein YqeY
MTYTALKKCREDIYSILENYLPDTMTDDEFEEIYSEIHDTITEACTVRIEKE